MGRRRGSPERSRPGLIVPQRSIDRVSLGMTRSKVRHVYGAPTAVRSLAESETGKPIVQWTYRRQQLIVRFRGPHLVAGQVLTTSRR